MLNRFVTCAAVALCTVAASTAHAALIKFKDWLPVGEGNIQNPTADGMGMLRYNHVTDCTEITIVLHGLLPNTAYGVWVDDDGGADYYEANGLVTNAHGSATFRNSGSWTTNHTNLNPVITIFIGAEPYEPSTHRLISVPVGQ